MRTVIGTRRYLCLFSSMYLLKIRESFFPSPLAIPLLPLWVWCSQLTTVTGSGTCVNPTATTVQVSGTAELKNGFTCANENPLNTYMLKLGADITLTSAWGTSSSNFQSRSGLWLGPNATVLIDGTRAGGGTWKLTRSQSAPELRLIYVSVGAFLGIENLELGGGKRPISEGTVSGTSYLPVNDVGHGLPCFFSRNVDSLSVGFVHQLHAEHFRTRALTLKNA